MNVVTILHNYKHHRLTVIDKNSFFTELIQFFELVS